MSTHKNERKALYDVFIDNLSGNYKEVSEDSQKGKREVSEGDLDASIFLKLEEKQLKLEEKQQIVKKRTEQFLEDIYEPVERSKVYGFDYDEKTLKMLLLNGKSQESFKLIGVVGVLGVGKSTLCRLIFTEEEVKQHFVPRIWIPMSEESETMENVVERLLDHLGVEEETIKSISNDHKLPGLLYALYLHLKGKRFLIVFDNVQDKDKYYEDLLSCLSNGHGFPKRDGGAVVVNSRNEEAIKKMVGDQNLHRLLPLSDPESCWNIYKQNWDVSKEEKKEDKKVEGLGQPQDRGSSASEEIKEVAGEIEGQDAGEDASKARKKVESQSPKTDVPIEVKEELKKKCGGIPLAARMMGEIKLLKETQDAAASKN
ncbi:hypothetical protein DITRI_Ditri07aG0175300 [Diplodiscus trichospermus]